MQSFHLPSVTGQAPGGRVEAQTRVVLLAFPLYVTLTQPHLPAALVHRHVHLPVPATPLQGTGGQDLWEGAEASLVLCVGLLGFTVGHPPVVIRQLQLGMGCVCVQEGDTTICTWGKQIQEEFRSGLGTT